jgi:hypothetical protein
MEHKNCLYSQFLTGVLQFNINRKRIKAIREALQQKGWRSLGF